jgi:hypothetical protein
LFAGAFKIDNWKHVGALNMAAHGAGSANIRIIEGKMNHQALTFAAASGSFAHASDGATDYSAGLPVNISGANTVIGSLGPKFRNGSANYGGQVIIKASKDNGAAAAALRLTAGLFLFKDHHHEPQRILCVGAGIAVRRRAHTGPGDGAWMQFSTNVMHRRPPTRVGWFAAAKVTRAALDGLEEAKAAAVADLEDVAGEMLTRGLVDDDGRPILRHPE